jgi:hypothetical protein
VGQSGEVRGYQAGMIRPRWRASGDGRSIVVQRIRRVENSPRYLVIGAKPYHVWLGLNEGAWLWGW